MTKRTPLTFADLEERERSRWTITEAGLEALYGPVRAHECRAHECGARWECAYPTDCSLEREHGKRLGSDPLQEQTAQGNGPDLRKS